MDSEVGRQSAYDDQFNKKWNSLINLPNEKLYKELNKDQQHLCHSVINFLSGSISDNKKVQGAAKLVICLPEEAVGNRELSKILDYMKESGAFYQQNFLGHKSLDPQLLEKMKTSITQGNGKVALALLEHDFPPPEKLLPELLLAACKGGQEEVVLKLLDLMPNVNIQDAYGITPLYYACESSLPKAVHKLLEKGADVNKSDPFNITPLHRATWAKNAEITLMLMGKGGSAKAIDARGRIPDINFRDANGDTPLHIACRDEKCLPVALALITAGADLYAKNHASNSPLYEAYKNRLGVVVEEFIKRGIDISQIQWEEEIKSVEEIDADFGACLARELGGKSKDSGEAKIFRQLIHKLKELDQENSVLPLQLQVNRSVFIKSLQKMCGDAQGAKFFQVLSKNIDLLSSNIKSDQFKKFPAYAKEIGGEQFQKDFIQYHSLLEPAFLKAENEDKMKMLLQAKYTEQFFPIDSVPSYAQVDALLSMCQNLQDPGDFIDKIMSNRIDMKKVARMMLQSYIPQLLEKTDIDPRMWFASLSQLLQTSGKLNAGDWEFTPEIIADVLKQFQKHGFPGDIHQFSNAVYDRNLINNLTRSCLETASNEEYSQSCQKLWKLRFAEKYGVGVFSQEFEPFFKGAVDSKTLEVLVNAAYEGSLSDNPKAIAEGYALYFQMKGTSLTPEEEILIPYCVHLPPIPNWEAHMANPLFADMLKIEGLHPRSLRELKIMDALCCLGLQSLQEGGFSSGGEEAVLVGCVKYLKRLRADFQPLAIPEDIVKLYRPYLPEIDGWQKMMGSSAESGLLIASIKKGPVSQDELRAFKGTLSAIKNLPLYGYSKEDAATAVRRYIEARRQAGLPLEARIPSHTLISACFEAAVENAAPEAIALFNLIPGKETPLTKEGLLRLKFLASMASDPSFAGGRPLGHFRVRDKFPVILRNIGIKEAKDLNSFPFSFELLHELFDEQQKYVFKNLNAHELLGAIGDDPQRAITAVLRPILAALLGKIDEKTAQKLESIVESITAKEWNDLFFQDLVTNLSAIKGVEFDVEVSSFELFSSLLTGLKEIPAIRQLFQSTAGALFDAQPKDEAIISKKSSSKKAVITAVDMVGPMISKVAQYTPQFVKDKTEEFFIEQAAARIVNFGITFLSNPVQTINSLQEQIFVASLEDGIKLQEELKAAVKAHERLKLIKQNPEIASLLAEVLVAFLKNKNVSGALGDEYTFWKNFENEDAITERITNTTEREVLLRDKREKLVDHLYSAAELVLNKGQIIFPRLFEGVIEGVKSIPQSGTKEIEGIIPIVIEERAQADQKIRNFLNKTLPDNNIFTQKKLLNKKELIPLIEQQFAGLQVNNLQALASLIEIGNEMDYSPKEIAIACKLYYMERKLSDVPSVSLYVSDDDKKLLCPFLFDAAVISMSENFRREGEEYLGEKLHFYLNHKLMAGCESPLTPNGRSALKEMLSAMCDPQFCQGLQLLNPLLLERFLLILQGTHLFDVNLLNVADTQGIKKRILRESHIVLNKIDLGRIQNAVTYHPQECMMAVTGSVIDVMTGKVSLETKMEAKKAAGQLFKNLGEEAIQRFQTFVRSELGGFNLQGVKLELSVSLPQLIEGVKERTEAFAANLESGKMPTTEDPLASLILELGHELSRAQEERNPAKLKIEKIKDMDSPVFKIAGALDDVNKYELLIDAGKALLSFDFVKDYTKSGIGPGGTWIVEKIVPIIITAVCEGNVKNGLNRIALLQGKKVLVLSEEEAKGLEAFKLQLKPLSLKEKEILLEEETHMLTLNKKLLRPENSALLVKIATPIVIGSLPNHDLEKLSQCFEYIRMLAAKPEMPVDQNRLMKELVGIFDILLDEVEVYHPLIPALLNALARMQSFVT